MMQACLGLVFALLVVVPEGAAWAQDGARLFERCYACHSLDPAERHLSGPTLRGIFGRRAGTVDGFDYSEAIRAAGRHGLVWSEETLDRFLADPEEIIPGVRMGGVRLRDPGERRALIRWLRTTSQ
jgi:cytochrome c